MTRVAVLQFQSQYNTIGQCSIRPSYSKTYYTRVLQIIVICPAIQFGFQFAAEHRRR